MASQVVREWIGINNFAMATQDKLLELLGRLKQEVLYSFLSIWSQYPCLHDLCFHLSFICTAFFTISKDSLAFDIFLQNVSTLTILVMGKGGVGKSSTVNSIVGERAVSVSPFQVLIIYSIYMYFAWFKCTQGAQSDLRNEMSIVRSAKACDGFSLEGWVYIKHHRYTWHHRRRLCQWPSTWDHKTVSSNCFFFISDQFFMR